MPGFRYALVLEQGHPADPAVFVSAVLDWDVGDEFIASSLQRFRILEILPGIDEHAEFNAVWIVEARDEPLLEMQPAS
jgi:hypothetical protein